MQLPKTTYIYPPRTKLATPFQQALQLQGMGYRAQFKFNDSHIVLWYDGASERPEIKLYSRHADFIKNYELPQSIRDQVCTIVGKLGLDPRGHHRFDGGLLHTKHTAIRNTIVLWDILVADGEYLTGTTYESRFERLQAISNHGQRIFLGKQYALQVGEDLTDDIFIPTWQEDWRRAWEGLTELNKAFEQPLIEGIVMKDPAGTLVPGFAERNDCVWMAKSRVETRRHLF